MLDAWVARRFGLTGPLTAEGLERCQLRALNGILSYARSRSPFYRSRLPEDPLSDFAGLSRLPFTTAADVAGCGTRLLCVRGSQVQRIVTAFTSGTTGPSKRIYSTAGDQARTVDFFRHGMATLIAPGERVLLLFPGDSPGSLNDLLAQGIGAMGAFAVPWGFPAPERYAALCDAIVEGGFTALVAPPSAAAGAAAWSRSHGRAEAVGRALKSVLLAAEYVSDDCRSAIHAAWGCTIHEHYGMTETGFVGPVSCSAHEGYHIPACDLLFEIIDPASLRPVPPGVWGEVVVTTLTREAMPLIRLRTGDRGRLLSAPCPCGSVLPRLDRVGSRPQPKKFQRPAPVSF